MLDEPCVVDGNLITARFPYDLPRMVRALVGQLAHGALDGISIETEGAAAELNQKPITGAVLGALVMQSLVSGMVLMGIEAPLQDIVVGVVLVVAVAIDTIIRRRTTR